MQHVEPQLDWEIWERKMAIFTTLKSVGTSSPSRWTPLMDSWTLWPNRFQERHVDETLKFKSSHHFVKNSIGKVLLKL